MKKFGFLFIFLFASFIVLAQKEQDKVLEYSFSEVEKLHKRNPKPILVFLSTDWCKICHGMKKNTFSNDEIIKKLNADFYFIPFNAESKEDISFLGKTFKYLPNGTNTGTHELALALGKINNKISYPTTVILNENFEIDLQIDSYLDSKKIKQVLETYLSKREI